MTLTAPTGWEARVEAAPSSQGRAGGYSVQVRREGDRSWLYLPNSIPAWWAKERVREEATKLITGHVQMLAGGKR